MTDVVTGIFITLTIFLIAKSVVFSKIDLAAEIASAIPAPVPVSEKVISRTEVEARPEAEAETEIKAELEAEAETEIKAVLEAEENPEAES